MFNQSLLQIESVSHSVVFNSLLLHGLQPARLFQVHGILQARILEWVAIPFSRGSSWPRDWTQVSHIADRVSTIWSTRKKESESSQLCQPLWYPIVCSLPGSSIHGLFQARILEWVAISSPRGSSQPRDETQVSRIAGRFYTVWPTSSVQFSSVAQSCPTLCDPMNRSMPGLPVHHQLPEFTQTHAHQISDAIQPSYPLSSVSPPAPNPSQYQSLFQWVSSWHEVAKVLEFQL